MGSLGGNTLSDLTVLIIGGGVGGLMTALELTHLGCKVRVLERTEGNIATGDSFLIGPTAINGFNKWPRMRQRNDEVAYHPLVAIHTCDGVRISGPTETEEYISEDTLNSELRVYRHSRPKIHQILMEQLAETGTKVEHGMEVTKYYEDVSRGRAGVVVKDGTKYEADLVVAADGLRGNSWPLIAGKPIPARSSGKAIFRVAFPAKFALADPLVAERFKLLDDGNSVMEFWMGPQVQVIFWMNGDEMHWYLSHDDDGSAAESWGHKANPKDVLKYTAKVPGWPEVADRVIMSTPPDQLVNWRLMWRDPQLKWHSPGGRVVQLGDAAHTFLPTSGNGGTQAIEDAISLAACIAHAGSKENVSDAVRVHNLLRFERVSYLQAFGVLNRAKWSGANPLGDRKSTKPQGMIHFGKWILTHDPENYVHQNYDEALSHLDHGTPFQNTNTPPGSRYKPWTIDGLIAAAERGEETVLDGDWD